MVLRLALQLFALGALLGVIGSIVSTRVLRGLLQNVSTLDVDSLAGTTTLLFSIGLFAGFWPARKAARVDPVKALREE